ncbi:MAG: YaaR family protein [Kurthia sp.]|nr:YaaR family protein [Candidatus Kurthia equi]
MKINQDLRVGNSQARKPLAMPQTNNKFGSMVVMQGQKMQSDQITKLLGDISTAGERIAKSKNFRDLAKFKMLIKRFLKETVSSGMELKQSHTWNHFGEGRRLKIVNTIDEKLIELTEDMLNEEKSTVDLLAKIGEIKGLLINLYT